MNKKKIIISWLLVIIWMVVIFMFSSFDSDKSNDQSKGIIDNVVTGSIEIGNQVGITDYHPTEVEKQEIVDTLNFPVRKMAHCFLYFILSLLIINALNESKVKRKYIITLIISFLYSLTDEFHQTIIDGRTGQLIDCFVDLSGAVIGCCFNYFILKIKSKKI